MEAGKYPEVNTCIASFRYQSACLPDSRAISIGHAHLANTNPPSLYPSASPNTPHICLLIDALKSVEVVQFSRS